MNTVIINLLEKEGYSCFGTLLDGNSDNTLGMCFIKDEKIYFYKESGDEISYEELFEYRKSDIIILEYSRIEKCYILSGDTICKKSYKDWNKKIIRCSYVVNVKKGCFSILREDSSFRFPLAVEYLKNSLLVYSSDIHESNVDSVTLLISNSHGYIYSIRDDEESNIEVATFYCKWNGWYIADSRNYYKNNVYVSVIDEILYIPNKSLLWKVPNNGNIWVISNLVNKSMEVCGFYAINAKTKVFCRLNEHCISWIRITISNSLNYVWIHSSNQLIKISERVRNINDFYCEISSRAKFPDYNNHSIVVLGKDYAVFKNNLGPIYYIYDLNSLCYIDDKYIEPTCETSESTHYHSVGIFQNNLHGRISLDKGELLIPIKYDGIESWESDGNVYGIVKIESKKNRTIDEDGEKIVFEGLYVNDRILIPPCCKRIERWITDDFNYHFEGHTMYEGYKNAGYIVFTLFNDTMGLCYNNEILEKENITEINQLGLEYAIVVKHDRSTLYHLNKKLFTERCIGFEYFTKDLLLMVGDGNQCGLITYDGKIKLPMGMHDLSCKSYSDGKESTLLIIDKDRNIYDSRDMQPLIPASLHLQDALIRYNKFNHRYNLCIACYGEHQDSSVFIDIEGNKLNSMAAIFEPIGEVLVVISEINIYYPIVDEEVITYNSEKEYEFDVFNPKLKKFITNDVYSQGYEIIKDENSQILIKKKSVEVQDYDEYEEREEKPSYNAGSDSWYTKEELNDMYREAFGDNSDNYWGND